MKADLYTDYAGKRLESELQRRVSHRGVYEAKLWEAMDYSLTAGGKRLRPLFTLLGAACVTGKAMEEQTEEVLPFACALEMIHTYSLIHDDLPAMDNDDYRRGRLTNHKVFGEGMAVLAGDGLLNLAFETLMEALQQRYSPERLKAAAVIARSAGAYGMVGGQAADILAEKQLATMDHLKYIEAHKTGAILEAAFLAGPLAVGAGEREERILSEAGRAFGQAFQIEDDILDVEGSAEELGKSVGKDNRDSKVTFVTLYGLEEAKRMASSLTEEAAGQILRLDNEYASYLAQWVRDLLTRRS